MSVKSSWVFYAGRFLFRLFFSLLWRLKIEGHENVPLAGGVIIAPNHASMADPPIVGCAMKRPLFFMAKKELFDMPLLGFIIRRTHAFEVRRGQRDVGAFRTAQRLLSGGQAVLVFPEGTRSRDGNFRSVLPGAGMLACMAQVPIVPVYIAGSNRISSLARLTVIMGKPIYPPAEFTRDVYQKLSESTMEAIKNLKKTYETRGTRRL